MKIKYLILVSALLLLFSSCSREIDTTVKQGNEGFVIGNGSTAVILTHGFAASPYEIKELSEYLAQRNMTVYGVRLDGHGTSVEDLSGKKWEDWYANFSDAYFLAKQTHKKVFVGGMSLGGVLALKTAEDNPVDGVIALAPAIILEDKRADYSWILKYFMRYSDRVIPQDKIEFYYDKFPIFGIAETLALGNIVESNLKKINEPILIMQYTNDTRVSNKSSQLVYDSVSSDKKDLVWVNGTGHVFLQDKDKELYFEKIYQFIKSNS